ncbi:MAG: tetratricopeptide repeat protein [Candidatus Cryptobacteroides sp.]
MRKQIKNLAMAVVAIAAVGCASPEKMAEMAESVTVTCDPSPLEVVAGKIDATVSVTYPADYFHKKAILEVTPVIVFDGGEAAMTPFMYQGEKVKDNYTVVSSDGQTVTEKVHFDYVEGMEACHLELRGIVKYKAKTWDLPIKKVADGANTTYMLVARGGKAGRVDYKADNYQEVIPQTAEGQILYTINSADVRSKELKSESIKDFQAALDEIKANERKTLKGTEVVAYASPDGGESLNAKLSDKRSKSGAKVWSKVINGREVADPEVKSIGQDWEGFQELVAKSDIEDKDLIIRVLSMYSDPAVRESEIKNMSEVYTVLKKEVLPELRRARFIANVEYQNYTAEELLKLVDENSDVLDEEALLRSASLVKDLDAKEAIYKKAIDKFNSDRAQFNLGVVYLEKGDLNKAEKAFAKVETKDADLKNAEGVIALRNGDLAAAEKAFAAAGNTENQAVVDILNGNYAKAAAALKGTNTFNEALADVLTDNLSAAAAALKCQCPKAEYLRAIIAARQGNKDEVAAHLAKAAECDALEARAEKDIEFAQYR